MFKNKKPVLAFIAASMLSAAMVSAQAETVVVAARNFAADKISVNQLEDIWLKKNKFFPEGSRVYVIDQAEGSRIRDDFYKKVTHKNPTQVKAFWTLLIFTGKGSAPKTLRDDNEVKHWVADTTGGIGYIDSASVDDSVKVLLRLP
jgi:ABC-type phosphate transport system substrate-binding protein